ncbi:MAG: carbamoyl-phosphate synthase large subunit [bacterium]
MPKRTDIKKILIIGSGPIIIGQACEFDYSGTQACKALKEEGYEVILVNSNPATIMTDPEFADKTYIEPVTPDIVELIIEKERPDALLPTMGGQTALNTAVALYESNVLQKYNVKMIGANFEAIQKAENRKLFKEAMKKINLNLPKSAYVNSLNEAKKFIDEVGYPVIIRPSFTLGGSGGSIAYCESEFGEKLIWGLRQSPVGEVLIEESIIGWKEYELEVMRDMKDNVVVICSIENFDPMGVHTGDSITVAPIQTLTDFEYQKMRDAAIACIREIGVDTGGSNIQFGINPEDGRMVVIEMNPRVSRSSALASKATGFPIAKIAAKLAVGYTLDEIPNDITRETKASFEPTIDYVVVKIPRWTFEKFPGSDPSLGPQMKSVGEVMSIGRTFKESLQKALRSLEFDRSGLGCDEKEKIIGEKTLEEILEKIKKANPERVFYMREAIKREIPVEEIHNLTKIDLWFLHQIKQIVDCEKEIRAFKNLEELPLPVLKKAKEFGFSDKQLSYLFNKDFKETRKYLEEKNLKPVYKLVDTCAAEFEAYTPYYYSTYETEDETKLSKKKKIIILGSGPNRIGQGIEFDYCCVQAALGLREDGYETIMVNSNPETVSTDYDISDKLFFEPLTLEDVLNIVRAVKPHGVIVQLGGQTPLKLAMALKRNKIPIIGTDPKNIDIAEDRKKFKHIVEKLDLHQPESGTATTIEQAVKAAKTIGYPVLVRPSYVLGGRGMEIVYDKADLEKFIKKAININPEHPILIDKFLEDAIEIDVDAISDGEITVIGGIMEHIEEAGIHSGDSACVLPPFSISDDMIDEIKKTTHKLAKNLKVIGLINIQYAIKDDILYLLEVNPRASRTIPFISKAIGVSLAKLAARVMAGKKLTELGFTKERDNKHICIKEAVLPFIKFPGVDIILGPEMKSTGEVMGIDMDFGFAYAKSQLAASQKLPLQGTVFISVRDKDKRPIIFVAKRLVDLGFKIVATSGTARVLQRSGMAVEKVFKYKEGTPDIYDQVCQGKIDLIINTPMGKKSKYDDKIIRTEATLRGIPCITTLSAAEVSIMAIEALKKGKIKVKSLQEYHVTNSET